MITPKISSSPFALPPLSPASAPTSAPETSFGQLLGDVAKEANTQQVKADAAVQGLMRGDSNTDIHQVMLSMEQARLSMMTMVEIRNKMVEAYQEISRMQM